MTEIIHTVETHEPTPMQLIAKATEAGVDPDAMSKLMDLQDRWRAQQAEERFSQAMGLFQSNCPQIRKEHSVSMGGRTAYTYASIDDIMAVIQPILTKYGLSVKYNMPHSPEGYIAAECIVRCGSHTETTSITLPVPRGMRVNDTQQAGAAISYAKRYALCAALNIVVSDEDRDGGNLGEVVSDGQLLEIEALLADCPKGTEARMLKWIGVDELDAIPADRFDDVKLKLKAKLKEGDK